MTNRRAVLAGAVLTGAAAISSAVLYPSLPELIPVHWGLWGEIDGWGEKWWAVLVMPAMMALCAAGIVLLPAISPRGFTVESFRSTFNYLMVAVTALLGFIHAIMLLAALRPELPSGRILISGLFIFLAVIGNVLGKVRRNFWIGIRTPWTLASDRVWAATHRLAAQLLVLAGIAGATLVWAGVSPAVCLLLFFAALIVPVVYSLVLYRRTDPDAR